MTQQLLLTGDFSCQEISLLWLENDSRAGREEQTVAKVPEMRRVNREYEVKGEL